MRELSLANCLYLCPTAVGAYYAVSSTAPCKARQALLTLMRQELPFQLYQHGLAQLTGLQEAASLELIRHLQQLKMVEGLSSPPAYLADTNLEEALPRLLGQLAGSGSSLLADEQGFYLQSHGFQHETSEELAALGAELCNLQRRYTGLLNGKLRRTSHAWALVGAGGYSDIGFWPLHCGTHSFILVLDSLPNLNQPATVELIWRLIRRYGSP